ncbi:MAG: phosphoglycerate kinase [Planctomycetes bacterium]|nr:phosphoglycerate kinase [Planctomycetota bacterium]
MKQTIEQIDVAGKRVLMRVDFNVPTQDGVIKDDRRIQMTLPSIKSVLDRGGKLTLLSHLGRPSGTGFEKAFSLAPVATRLGELLGRTVVCSDEDKTSDIVLAENLRFNSGEKLGDATYAKQLAKRCDIYCNNAFGTAHRNHASMVAVPEAMQGKPRVAGLLLARELQYLDDAIANAQKPFIAVIGGAKVSDKMGAIENLLGKVDSIIIGGAMAYTFLVAQDIEVGASLVESDRIEDARSMIAIASASSTALLLPSDHVCAQEIAEGTQVHVSAGSIPEGMMGLDIGPETVECYSNVIQNAKTIVWNGPMGVFEIPPFDAGTRHIAQAIAQATRQGAISIVGGGDSAAAISAFGLEEEMTHISTGGGASLQMLEGKGFKSVAMLDDDV